MAKADGQIVLGLNISATTAQIQSDLNTVIKNSGIHKIILQTAIEKKETLASINSLVAEVNKKTAKIGITVDAKTVEGVLKQQQKIASKQDELTAKMKEYRNTAKSLGVVLNKNTWNKFNNAIKTQNLEKATDILRAAKKQLTDFDKSVASMKADDGLSYKVQTLIDKFSDFKEVSKTTKNQLGQLKGALSRYEKSQTNGERESTQLKRYKNVYAWFEKINRLYTNLSKAESRAGKDNALTEQLKQIDTYLASIKKKYGSLGNGAEAKAFAEAKSRLESAISFRNNGWDDDSIRVYADKLKTLTAEVKRAEKEMNAAISVSSKDTNYRERIKDLQAYAQTIKDTYSNISGDSRAENLVYTSLQKLDGLLRNVRADRSGQLLAEDFNKANIAAKELARNVKLLKAEQSGIAVDDSILVKLKDAQSRLTVLQTRYSNIGDNASTQRLLASISLLENELNKVDMTSHGDVLADGWKKVYAALQVVNREVKEYNARVSQIKPYSALLTDIEKKSQEAKSGFDKSQFASMPNVKLSSTLGTLAQDAARLRNELNDLDVTDGAQMQTMSERVSTLDKRFRELSGDIKIFGNGTEINKFTENVDKAKKKVEEYGEKYTAVMGDSKLSKRLSELKAQINEVGDFAGLKKWNKDFAEFDSQVQISGKHCQSLKDRLKEAFQHFGEFFSASRTIYQASEAVKQMGVNVRDLDSAMTDLKKVTDATDAEFNAFFERSKTSAVEYATTMKDLINSTANFSRLGYSLDESEQLAKVASVYNEVGDIDNIEEASKSIISTMKAYGIAADNAESIIDKFNEVGNTEAIDSAGIGEAFQRSASSLAAANNTIDQSIALITAGNAVTQDPDVVGTALKSISMRIRQATTELETAGESTEGMAESTAKLREEIKGLSGVDIMDSQNEFKSTYQILDELSAKWQSLTDIQQASITKLVAGTYHGNVMSSLMENFDIARRSLDTSLNSEGSAMKEFNTQLTSIDAKTKQFQAAFEALSTAVVNSDFLKTLVDSGTSLLKILNTLIEKSGGITNLLMGISSIIATWNLKIVANGLSNLWGKLTGFKNKFIDKVDTVRILFLYVKDGINAAVDAAKNGQSTIKAFTSSFDGLGSGLGGKTTIAAMAITAVTTAISAGIAIYKNYKQAQKEAREETINNANKTIETAKAMQQAYSVYEQYSDRQNLTASEEEAFKGAIDSVTESLGKKNAALQEAKVGTEEYAEALKEVTHEDTVKAYAAANSAQDALKANLKEVSGSAFHGSELIFDFPREKQLQDVVKRTMGNFVLPSVYGTDVGIDNFDYRWGDINKVVDYYYSLQNLQKGLNDTALADNGEGKGLNDTVTNHISKLQESVDAYVQNQLTLASTKYLKSNDIPTTENEFKEYRNYISSELSNQFHFSDDKTLSEVVDSYLSQNEKYSEFITSLENADKTSSEIDEKIAGLKQHTKGSEFAVKALGRDVTDHIFGNIDLNNRSVLTLTDENFEKYKDVLKSWTDDIEGMRGDIMTVFGGAEKFNGVEIAFSPMLQTDEGAVLLDRDTVYNYIQNLMDNLPDGWTSEDLLKLDAEGLEIDGKKIKGLIADIGATATKSAEAMHYLGTDGAINSAKKFNEWLDDLSEKNKNLVYELSQVEDTDGWGLTKWNYELEKLKNNSEALDVLEEKFKAIQDAGTKGSFDLDKEKEKIEGLTTALSSSVSATGLTDTDITALKTRYGELSTYDESVLFEKTANGIHLNSEAVKELESEYRNLNKTYVDTKLETEISNYNDLTKQINECTDASEREQLILKQNTLETQIEATQRLATQYEGLTSAYQGWLEAQEGGEEGDIYDNITSGLEGIKNLYEEGLVGTNEFASAVQLMSNEDLSGASPEELKEIYNKRYAVMADYFTTTSDGVEAFLKKISELNSKWASQDENGNWTLNVDSEELAKEFGISEDAIEAILKKASDYGLTESFKSLTGDIHLANNELTLANEKLKELNETDTDFNFGTTSVDELNTQIEEAEKILGGFKNTDGTVQVGVEGAEEAKQILLALIVQKQQLTKPDIMAVDTGDAQDGLERTIYLLQEFQKAQNEIEQGKKIGVDTTEAEKKVQDLTKEIQGLSSKDLKISGVTIDPKNTESIKKSIESISADDLIKAGMQVDEDALNKFKAENHDIPANIKYGYDTSAVPKSYSEVFNRKGKITYTATIDGKTYGDTGTTTITPGTSVFTGKQVNKNNAVKFTPVGGSAFVDGTGADLISEPAPEILVRDGKWHLIDKAKFFKFRRGDIVFNPKQTQELIDTGQVKSDGGHGKAYASGTIINEKQSVFSTKTSNAKPDFTISVKDNRITGSGKLTKTSEDAASRKEQEKKEKSLNDTVDDNADDLKKAQEKYAKTMKDSADDLKEAQKKYKDSMEDYADDIEEAQKKYAESMEDIAEDVKEANKKYKETIEDLDKDEHLKNLQYTIDKASESLDAFDRKITQFTTLISLAYDSDYMGKRDATLKEMETSQAQADAIKAEMDRLMSIVPQTGDEASAIASQLETLSSDYSEALEKTITARKEANEFFADSVSAAAKNAGTQVSTAMDIYTSSWNDKDKSSLFGGVWSRMLTPSVRKSSLEKERSEAQELIEAREYYEAAAAAAKSEATDMTKADEDKERQKSRQDAEDDLAKSLKAAEKSKRDAEDDLAESLRTIDENKKTAYDDLVESVDNVNQKVSDAFDDYNDSVTDVYKKTKWAIDDVVDYATSKEISISVKTMADTLANGDIDLQGYAKGTGTIGVAGENNKPEILVSKKTGKARMISSPTLFNTKSFDVVGERDTQRLKGYADGTEDGVAEAILGKLTGDDGALSEAAVSDIVSSMQMLYESIVSLSNTLASFNGTASSNNAVNVTAAGIAAAADGATTAVVDLSVLAQQISSQIQEMGAQSLATWNTFVGSNPLAALQLMAESWNSLQNSVSTYIQSLASISTAGAETIHAIQITAPQIDEGTWNSLQTFLTGKIQETIAAINAEFEKDAINLKFKAEIEASGNTAQGMTSGTSGGHSSAALVNAAKQHLGLPYVWGGTSAETGWDCSGMVVNLLGDGDVNKGIEIAGGRTTYAQWGSNNGQRITDFNQLQPGDCVYFSNNGDVHHVGIYEGNGMMIHAPHTGDVTKETNIADSSYYRSQFIGAKRYAKGTGSFGVAGENYRPELMLDKKTGHVSVIDRPTLFNRAEKEIVGEKTTAQIRRKYGNNLPEYAKGTIPVPEGLGKYYTYETWNREEHGMSGWSSGSNQKRLIQESKARNLYSFDTDGFGHVGNRYTVAMTSTFGAVGDCVDIYMSNGRVIHAIIGDEKSQTVESWDPDPANKWGHQNGQVIVEFMTNWGLSHSNPPSDGTVLKVDNVGNWFEDNGLATGVGSSFAGHDFDIKVTGEMNGTGKLGAKVGALELKDVALRSSRNASSATASSGLNTSLTSLRSKISESIKKAQTQYAQTSKLIENTYRLWLNNKFGKVILPTFARGTGDWGVAGENRKPEILVDKNTGKKRLIKEPTLINLRNTDVVGEKATERLRRNHALPKFAEGTVKTEDSSKDSSKESEEKIRKDYAAIFEHLPKKMADETVKAIQEADDNRKALILDALEEVSKWDPDKQAKDLDDIINSVTPASKSVDVYSEYEELIKHLAKDDNGELTAENKTALETLSKNSLDEAMSNVKDWGDDEIVTSLADMVNYLKTATSTIEDINDSLDDMAKLPPEYYEKYYRYQEESNEYAKGLIERLKKISGERGDSAVRQSLIKEMADTYYNDVSKQAQLSLDVIMTNRDKLLELRTTALEQFNTASEISATEAEKWVDVLEDIQDEMDSLDDQYNSLMETETERLTTLIDLEDKLYTTRATYLTKEQEALERAQKNAPENEQYRYDDERLKNLYELKQNADERMENAHSQRLTMEDEWRQDPLAHYIMQNFGLEELFDANDELNTALYERTKAALKELAEAYPGIEQTFEQMVERMRSVKEDYQAGYKDSLDYEDQILTLQKEQQTDKVDYYEKILNRMKEIKSTEKEYNDLLTDGKKKRNDILQSLREERREITSQLAANKEIDDWLSEDTRKLLFNDDDYAKEMEAIDSIEDDVKDLYEQYQEDLSNLDEDTWWKEAAITAEYEKQLEPLNERLELAKQALAVAKKQTEYENRLKERDTVIYTGNRAQMVADPEELYNIAKEKAELEQKLDDTKTNYDEDADIREMERSSDKISNEIANLNDSVTKIGDMTDDMREYLAQFLPQMETLVAWYQSILPADIYSILNNSMEEEIYRGLDENFISKGWNPNYDHDASIDSWHKAIANGEIDAATGLAGIQRAKNDHDYKASVDPGHTGYGLYDRLSDRLDGTGLLKIKDRLKTADEILAATNAQTDSKTYSRKIGSTVVTGGADVTGEAPEKKFRVRGNVGGTVITGDADVIVTAEGNAQKALSDVYYRDVTFEDLFPNLTEGVLAPITENITPAIADAYSAIAESIAQNIAGKDISTDNSTNTTFQINNVEITNPVGTATDLAVALERSADAYWSTNSQAETNR